MVLLQVPRSLKVADVFPIFRNFLREDGNRGSLEFQGLGVADALFADADEDLEGGVGIEVEPEASADDASIFRREKRLDSAAKNGVNLLTRVGATQCELCH